MTAPQIAQRVVETTTTTGSTDFSLGGAKDNSFQTFVGAGFGGNDVFYTVVHQNASIGEWETGIGSVTDASTDSLSRDTVIDSSTGGTVVTFSTGTKDVRIDPVAGWTDATVKLDETDVTAATSAVDFFWPSGVFSEIELRVQYMTADSNVRSYLRLSPDGTNFDSTNTVYEWVVQARDAGGGDGSTNAAGANQIDLHGGDAASAGAGLSLNVRVHRPGKSQDTEVTYSGSVDDQQSGNLLTFSGSGAHGGSTSILGARFLAAGSTVDIASGLFQLYGSF